MSKDRDDDATGVAPAEGSADAGSTEAGSSAITSTATATRRRRGSAQAPVAPTGKAGRGRDVANTRRDADEPEDTRTARANPISFVKQVFEELRKVIWPTGNQMVTYTIVVFLFLIFFSALVAGVDFGAGKLVELVFEK